MPCVQQNPLEKAQWDSLAGGRVLVTLGEDFPVSVGSSGLRFLGPVWAVGKGTGEALPSGGGWVLELAGLGC